MKRNLPRTKIEAFWREEIGRAKVTNPEGDYRASAARAAERMTPDYLRRGKRINSLGPSGAELFEHVKQLSRYIADALGSQAAIDMLEQAAHIMGSLRPPETGKAEGPHNAERDAVLLEMFDEKDPRSMINKIGFTKEQFARHLTKTAEGRERWGVAGKRKPLSAQAATDRLLRRMRGLRSTLPK